MTRLEVVIWYDDVEHKLKRRSFDTEKSAEEFAKKICHTYKTFYQGEIYDD
jgi:hypothetical protein